jgi:hypothetical protein
MIKYMAPHKALAKQKRGMRRFCRKPAGMTVRTFTNHLFRINTQEIPYLPNYGGTNLGLSPDEIIDIVLNGIPHYWVREMDKLGFDPVEHSLAEVIAFCERMEEAEDFDPARNGSKTTKTDKSKNGKSKSSPPSSSKKGGGKFCLLHGDNPTHVTDECHVLKKQAKTLRRDDGDRKPAAHSKNKTWRRDADKSTNSSKKELATFVRKQARKELFAFAKKRKADDDEKSTGSLNNVENVSDGEIDLSLFNYTKMGDLKIDSDDDDDSDDGGSISC